KAALEKSRAATPLDQKLLRQQIKEQLKTGLQIVPPGYPRQWKIDLGLARLFLKDRPLYLRVKFNSSEKSPTGTFTALFAVGDLESPQVQRLEPMSLAPDTFHEFEIPANKLDAKGVLTVTFWNPNNTSLLFPIEDGMEVLYRQGGFGA